MGTYITLTNVFFRQRFQTAFTWPHFRYLIVWSPAYAGLLGSLICLYREAGT